MSRKELTKVEKQKLVAIAEKQGLEIVSKKGWTKCYLPGTKKALGIPNTDQVTRVELVGFESEVGVAHPAPPAGTVTQMLDFGQEEQMVLRDFAEACRVLMALKAAPPAEESEESEEQEETEEQAASGNQ